MTSGDPRVLDPGSAVSGRIALQRAQIDALDVFVWPRIHSLSDIFRAAQQNAYDVITAQDPFWRGLVAWRVARHNGIKLNLQIHTDLSHESFMKRMLARFLLPKADSVRVVSEKIKNSLAQFHIRGPVFVLPVYVDINPFRGLPHQSHSRFKKTILWVGRFEPEKDPLAAIAVLKQVRRAKIDAGLVMLGAGSLEHESKEEAQALAPFVEFPGWRDPAPYLQTADVVVSTSLFESYGASIIEALAAGVPVVSPDVGVAREAGAIIAPRAKLGEAVIEVLNRGTRGELKLALQNKEEWAKQWKETLV